MKNIIELDMEQCIKLLQETKNIAKTARILGVNENLIYPILQIYHQIENKVYVPRKYPELFEEEKNVKEG